jgi:hypothetical protein
MDWQESASLKHMNTEVNESIEAESMEVLYSQFCSGSELVKKMKKPEIQADSLASAVNAASHIIGRLAMMVAALDKMFQSLERNVDQFAKEKAQFFPNIEATPQERWIDESVDSLIGVYRMFMISYQGEADFCSRFEKYVRENMLVKVGIDPSNTEEAMNYLRQRSIIASTPTNPGN